MMSDELKGSRLQFINPHSALLSPSVLNLAHER